MAVRLIYILLISVFAFNNVTALEIEPVILKCTQVNNDGSVEIFWENPPDLTDFKQFDVYETNSDGTASSLIGSINDANTTSFHHPTTDGNLIQKFYYVLIINQSDLAYGSDIIGTIWLQLDTSNPGIPSLLWTEPTSESYTYNIYKYVIRDGIPPAWELVYENFENTIYNYLVEDGLCDNEINFRIEIVNDFCTSKSNIKGDRFSEINKPVEPIFDSVSINDQSYAIIGWEASVSPDVVEYILYDIQDDGTAIEFVRTTELFYVDTREEACNENRKYDIAAVDGCGNIGLKIQKPQRPILFYDIAYSVCAQQDTLVWEQYINAEPNVENYLVWRNINGGQYDKIATIDGQPAINPPTGILIDQMWFIDEDVNSSTNYEYYIQAIFANGSSSSCKKDITTYSYRIPEHLYFANADVSPSNEIELTLDVDIDVYSCVWEIHRFDPLNNSNNNFINIERNQLQEFPLKVTDTEADPQSTYYEYYAIVYDSCGFEIFESNTLNTIYLQASKLNENTNRLEWTAFSGWETDVEKYFIYRSSMNNFEISPIDSVDANTFTYDDLINSDLATSGKLLYWVKAKQSHGGLYDFQSFSNSNIVNIVFETNVFFANAFHPGGINNEFKPVFSFFSGSDYLFQIYNRWGQLIFETSDSEEGWDGKIENEEQTSGAYVYRLSYKNILGISIEKTGSFMLVN